MNPARLPAEAMAPLPSRERSSLRLALTLAGLAAVLVLAGLAAGAEGWSLAWRDDAALIVAIRLPRTLGALLAGALLGVSGALA
jgi:cobalamin transport system permease protein